MSTNVSGEFATYPTDQLQHYNLATPIAFYKLH